MKAALMRLIGIGISISLLSCEENEREYLTGSAWKRDAAAGGKTPITLLFRENGNYKIIFTLKMAQFPGNFEISEDVMRMTDFYCGTDLPGLYRFAIRDDKLHFELIEDQYCERRKMFPGSWTRLNEAEEKALIDSLKENAGLSPVVKR